MEEDTGWRLNRHRDSLDITDEELSTSIVSLHRKTRPFYFAANISLFSAVKHTTVAFK